MEGKKRTRMKKLLTILFALIAFVASAQSTFNRWVPTSGTDTYTTNITSYTGYANSVVYLKFGNTNTGASTININSIGAANIRYWDGNSWEPLPASHIDVNTVYKLSYNGTYFEMESFGTGTGGGGTTMNKLPIEYKVTNYSLVPGDTSTLLVLNSPLNTLTIGNFATGVDGSQFVIYNETGATVTINPSTYITKGPLEILDTTYAYIHFSADTFRISTATAASGSGTVNSGTQYRLGYYATTGTTISEAGAITAGRALKSDANGVPTHFDTATEPSLTELSYVKGLTSSAQDQINNLSGFSEVGNIITEDWADLADWTKVGTQTFTVASNELSVVGGSPGSVTLSNYYYNSAYGRTCYQHWTKTLTVKVGTLSASSYGVGFGIQSSAVANPSSVQFVLMLDNTNKGHIRLYSNNNNSTVIAQTVRPLPSVTANDEIEITIRRIYRVIQITATNITTSPRESVSLIINADDYAGTVVLPNVGYFSIYAAGGTHIVEGDYSVNVNQKLNSDLLIVGDSRVLGSQASNQTNGWIDQMRPVFKGRIDTYASQGSINSDYVAAEILALQPRNILFLSGTNNIAAGDNATTTVTQAQTLFSSLTGFSLGTNLFYVDELPRGDVDITALSTAYKTTLGASGCIYVFNSFRVASGTGPITSLFSSDTIHPNNIGSNILANTIANQLTFLVKADRAIAQTSYVAYQGGRVNISNAHRSPNHMLEVCDIDGLSQIRVGASNSRTGGFITSATDNQLSMFGGFYRTSSGTFVATATSGSAIGINSGAISLSTFSGATVGSAPTIVTRIYIDNSGNINTNTTGSAVYRTTNGGSDVTAHLMVDPAGAITAGSLSYGFDSSNGNVFNSGNGSRRIAIAALKLNNLTNTAGSETGDLTLSTKPSGSAMRTVLKLSGTGNVRAGLASLATTATDGFLYIPQMAGTPTGTPTTETGFSPFVHDTTNARLYIWDGTTWKYATLN